MGGERSGGRIKGETRGRECREALTNRGSDVCVSSRVECTESAPLRRIC
jgi:hypothetical protein